MNIRGMRCALSIHQKECRKSLGCALYIGARYLPEKTVMYTYTTNTTLLTLYYSDRFQPLKGSTSGSKTDTLRQGQQKMYHR
jgi:hypothetical protein